MGARRKPGVQDQKPEDPRKRQADQSDVRQEYARFTKPDPVFGPMEKADGRQPFMPKSISRPLPLKTYPFRFAHARRVRPLIVGRVRNAFSSSDCSI